MVLSSLCSAVNWLEPQQTLREQGLTDETTVVTLRKRFFFSDQNVNANDPVQLRLLYEQVCVSYMCVSTFRTITCSVQ